MVKVKKVNTKVAKQGLGVVKTKLTKVKKTAKRTVKKAAKATTRGVKNWRNKGKRGKRQKLNEYSKDRGVVYIRHIPHGFHELEMFKYFRQFGTVTAIKFPRSKNGIPKGFAFIEFEYKEIAKVVADTMDNYLMFGSLVKTEYIPPEKQKPHLFHRACFPWSDTTFKNAVDERRKLDTFNKNKPIDDTTFAAKINKKLSKLQKNLLKKTGVQYKFQINETDDEHVQLLNVKPSTSEAPVSNNVKKPKKRSLSAASVDGKKKLSKLDETDDKIKIKKSPNAVKKFIKTSKSKLKTVKSKTDVVKSKLKTEAKTNKKVKDLKSNVKKIKNKVQTKTKNVVKPKTKSVKTAKKATSNKNKTKNNNPKFITEKIVKKGGTKKSK